MKFLRLQSNCLKSVAKINISRSSLVSVVSYKKLQYRQKFRPSHSKKYKVIQTATVTGLSLGYMSHTYSKGMNSLKENESHCCVIASKEEKKRCCRCSRKRQKNGKVANLFDDFLLAVGDLTVLSGYITTMYNLCKFLSFLKVQLNNTSST